MVTAREVLMTIRSDGPGSVGASALKHVLHARKADGCGNSHCLCFCHIRLGTDEENAADRAHDHMVIDRGSM